MEKIGFVSLGCAKNQVDSERMMGRLKEAGYALTPDPEQADYIFVNTCGFIQSAKEESINAILEMAEYKKHRCRKLFVMGCLAQRYKEELEKEIPEIDRIIPIREYPDIPKILEEELRQHFPCGNPPRLLASDPWTAYLKIAEGCSNHCAYCAIPLMRGKLVSEKEEDLVTEAEQLVQNGVKELVLVAQDTTMYGTDLYQEKRLGDLVLKLDQIKGVEWIRVLYLYPSEIDEKLLGQLKEAKHFVHYFDIPLQHGSDEVLHAMKRKTNVQKTEEILGKIREMFPDAVIRTTMMVGFPGETKEQFQDLLDFVRRNEFDRLGAFAYSREEDTPAYSMEHQVSQKTKENRLRQLMELQQGISQKRGERFVGKTLDVLIEGTDELGLYTGRSYASAPDGVDGIVTFGSTRVHDLGDFAQVKIEGAEEYDLFGNEVEE